MGDRLVLWSGGGRYIASKDVAGAAIAYGFKVQETGEFFEGSNPLISKDEKEITVIHSALAPISYTPPQGYEIYDLEDGESTAYRYSTISNGAALVDRWGSYIGNPQDIANYSSSIGSNGFTTLYSLVEYYKNKPNLLPAEAVSQGYDNEYDDNSGQIEIVWSIRLKNNFLLIISTSQGLTEKIYSFYPSLSVSCAIKINFTDNSTNNIPLSTCPDWVQVKPANSCPDGTVKECHHGATVCCYACDNGRLILVDKFNKN